MEAASDTLERGYDLVYSPDDDGFYLQRWSDDATSQIFPTRAPAIAAYKQYRGDVTDAIVWDL